jgi:purine-nucleoside phosphorylase
MKMSGQGSNAAERLQSWGADIAIVLGSGLNAIIPNASDEQIVAYTEFKELPCPSAPGHSGRFVLKETNHTRVIFAQGRVHIYEGLSARDVTAAIRVLASAGIKTLIVTNAAGSVNPDLRPGSWMMIRDHINLTGTTPLLGAPRFVDLTTAYSKRWRERFAKSASNIGMLLPEGVYAGLLGPQYETPAEVRMLQRIGADAVGMSTVLEVIQARALGLEVAGFSCLTNFGAGISAGELRHEEVLEIGKAAATDFAKLLNATF